MVACCPTFTFRGRMCRRNKRDKVIHTWTTKTVNATSMNCSKEKIEKMRAMTKWKYVLKLVLNDRVGQKHQDRLDLLIVRTHDTGMTATDQKTHRATTLGFEEVFNRPEIHKEDIHTTDKWQRCMQDEKLFLRQTEYTKVPVALRKRVYDALDNVPGRDGV